MLEEGVGSSVRRERDHLHVAVLGWVRLLYRLWQKHGETHSRVSLLLFFYCFLFLKIEASVSLQVFDSCRCVALANVLPGNLTATLGRCPRRDSCDRIFPYFMALSVLSSFIISLGGTPGFMVLVRSAVKSSHMEAAVEYIFISSSRKRNLKMALFFRCMNAELKSLAIGIHTLATRTLGKSPLHHTNGCVNCVNLQSLKGISLIDTIVSFTAGIPAPIYFGAVIDTTCLKWGYTICEGRGACRIYNTSAYR